MYRLPIINACLVSRCNPIKYFKVVLLLNNFIHTCPRAQASSFADSAAEALTQLTCVPRILLSPIYKDVSLSCPLFSPPLKNIGHSPPSTFISLMSSAIVHTANVSRQSHSSVAEPLSKQPLPQNVICISDQIDTARTNPHHHFQGEKQR